MAKVGSILTNIFLITLPLSCWAIGGAGGALHSDVDVSRQLVVQPPVHVSYYSVPVYYNSNEAVMTMVGENEYNQEQRAMADDLQLLITSPQTATQLKDNSGSDAATALGKLILSAKKSIDVEAFYINNLVGSKFDQQIIQNLIKRAQNGVKIRIIVDAKMAKTYPDEVDKLAKIQNIKVVKTDYFNLRGGIVHAKMMVVDNQSFFIGSQNLDWIAFSLNHELGVIHSDSLLANQLEVVFNRDWQNGGGTLTPAQAALQIQPKNKGLIFVGTSPQTPKVMDEIDNLTALISGAKKTIQLQAMTFSNHDPYAGGLEWNVLFNALESAAERGVVLQIMVANWEFSANNVTANNKFLQQLMLLPNVTIKYSSLPPSVPCIPFSSVDHAKYMVVDDSNVWVGTGNLEEGYFTQSRDYSVFVFSNSNFAAKVSNNFKAMWQSPYVTTYTHAVDVFNGADCRVESSQAKKNFD